jgi:uncharacterized protein (TIGR03663 family)
MVREKELKLLLVILAIALVTRLFMLDVRPMDHDESVHAYLSYVLLKHHAYRYDPAFHGPFLYFASAGLFAVLGDSEFVARLTPVVFSLIGIVTAFKFRRWIGKGAYVLTFLMLFSPSILYYSRYMRNDLILVGSFIAVIYCYFRYIESRDERFVYPAVLLFSVMICAKENAYIYLFTFLSFVVLYGLYSEGLDYLKSKLTLWDDKKLRMVAISAVIFCTVFVSLYSAGFSDWDGVKRATIGALEHWFKMHANKDHWKPIYYYSTLILRYEFMPLVLTIIAIPEFIKRLKERNASKLELFAFYWLVVSLLAYHVLSHKVPWLLVHLVAPMALFGSLYIDRLDSRNFRVILAILSAVTVAVSFYVTYVNYNDAVNEGLIYIQVQPSAVELANKIVELSRNHSIVVYEPTNDYWPLPWYLRHYSIPFMSHGNVSRFDYVVTSERMASEVGGEVIGRFEIRPFYYMVLIEMH